jgi:hypothetical protein
LLSFVESAPRAYRLKASNAAPPFSTSAGTSAVLGIPAVHGLKANLALGIATLLERQTSRRHLIFGPAIRTFEDHHHFTMAHG